jgi:uncharacterized membrane protein
VWTYVNNRDVRLFALVIIVVGSLLLLAAVVRGATIAVALIRGIPIHSLGDISLSIINILFEFIIPVAGGGLLIIAGNTFLHARDLAQERLAERRRVETASTERAKIISRVLSPDERGMLDLLKGKDFVLQSDLMVLTGYSKVKVHRLLKRLEAKGLVRRSRFGITNRVFAEQAR